MNITECNQSIMNRQNNANGPVDRREISSLYDGNQSNFKDAVYKNTSEPQKNRKQNKTYNIHTVSSRTLLPLQLR